MHQQLCYQSPFSSPYSLTYCKSRTTKRDENDGTVQLCSTICGRRSAYNVLKKNERVMMRLSEALIEVAQREVECYKCSVFCNVRRAIMRM